MTDLKELYQALIVDHNRSPRNFHSMDHADAHAEGFNPLCGDQVTVWVRLEGDRIADVSFQGQGCAISKASASLMTTAVKGRTVEEAETLFGGVRGLLKGEPPAPNLGKLAALGGVAEFPMRVKCATLSWHALHAALQQKEGAVSTE